MCKCIKLLIWIALVAISQSVLSEAERYISASAEPDEGDIIQFRFENISDKVLNINRAQFHRNDMMLTILYGQGLPLKESWVPESSSFSLDKMDPGEVVSFSVDLTRRFPELRKMKKSQCLFLSWGINLDIGGTLANQLLSGSLVLNEAVCLKTHI